LNGRKSDWGSPNRPVNYVFNCLATSRIPSSVRTMELSGSDPVMARLGRGSRMRLRDAVPEQDETGILKADTSIAGEIAPATKHVGGPEGAGT